MQTPDAFQWQRSTLSGIAGGDIGFILNPPLFCLVELTGLLAYRVPYSRPARTMPSGMETPARRWLAAARCAVPQVHVMRVPAAPAPPGSHRTRGQCDPARRRSDARPPEVAQESTHRLFTGILRARGYGASRPVVASGRRFVVCGAAWGGAPPTRVPPGAEHRSIAFLLPPYRSYTRSPGAALIVKSKLSSQLCCTLHKTSIAPGARSCMQ